MPLLKRDLVKEVTDYAIEVYCKDEHEAYKLSMYVDSINMEEIRDNYEAIWRVVVRFFWVGDRALSHT